MEYKLNTHYRKKTQEEEKYLETCMIEAVLSTHLKIQRRIESKLTGFSNPVGKPQLMTKKRFDIEYREFEKGE